MDKQMQNMQLYLTKEMHAELKNYCASKGMTMNGFIKALISRHMDEVKKREAERLEV